MRKNGINKIEHLPDVQYTGEEGEGMSDNVNHPSHYADHCSLECIEVMRILLKHFEDGFIGYLVGNAFKYMWRYKYKERKEEDLLKARWYLNEANKYSVDPMIGIMQEMVTLKKFGLLSEGVEHQE